MIALRIEDLELTEAWQEADPTMRERFAFPLDARSGATSTAVVYFEVDPGHHCGRHAHSAEEVLLVLEGEAGTRETIDLEEPAQARFWWLVSSRARR